MMNDPSGPSSSLILKVDKKCLYIRHVHFTSAWSSQSSPVFVLQIAILFTRSDTH